MKLRYPNSVTLYADGIKEKLAVQENMIFNDVKISLKLDKCLSIFVTSQTTALRFLRLRFNYETKEERNEPIKVLGDAWERGYANLGWYQVRPSVCMPWYCLVSNGSDTNSNTKGRKTECFGVKTGAGALCFWQYDFHGVTLWLDLRNGGDGVLPSGRNIHACDVVFETYDDISAYDALRNFTSAMCDSPLGKGDCIFGSNNWYYAYGISSYEDIVRDSKLIVKLTKGLSDKPYMVIDDGWQMNKTDAPWVANERFNDMEKLCKEMKQEGVIPGIWIRYLIDRKHLVNELPDECRLSRDNNVFDPTHPLVKEYIVKLNKMIKNWGFEIIKHDFSTYDIFGRWGSQMPNVMTDDGWHFYDRTKTSAEIVVDFYKLILDSADGVKILGCNTISHLSAGLVHACRTGDDTSGKSYERTRKYGVNTLAFRLAQQGSFYGADADCVGATKFVSWNDNRKWLDLLAHSGSPLFISCDPFAVGEVEEKEIAEAMSTWLKSYKRSPSCLRPLDWMETNTPEQFEYTAENGEKILLTYNWNDSQGATSFEPKV